MKINKSIAREEFKGEEGDALYVCYDRDVVGDEITLCLRDGMRESEYAVTIDRQELGQVVEALEAPLHKVSLRLSNANGEDFSLHYNNRGEPFREGIRFALEDEEWTLDASVFLETYELKKLHKLLKSLLEEK